MPDAFSTGMSTYAILEADSARQAAEAAELRAFVSGYSHVSATPQERQRYVEAVQKMYPPQTARDLSPAGKQALGGCIIGVFVWLAVGAVIGKLRHDDIEAGLACAVLSLALTCVGACGIALLAFAVSLVLGYV